MRTVANFMQWHDSFKGAGQVTGADWVLIHNLYTALDEGFCDDDEGEEEEEEEEEEEKAPTRKRRR